MFNPPVFLSGRAITGYRQGRLLGFPTANLALINSPDLSEGVYVGQARIIPETVTYPSLVFWGKPYLLPEAQAPRLEVHIVKQNLDLYDKIIEISLLSFVRENRKFIDENEAKESIKKDLHFALNYFKHV